jgi:hypothetical protein
MYVKTDYFHFVEIDNHNNKGEVNEKHGNSETVANV